MFEIFYSDFRFRTKKVLFLFIFSVLIILSHSRGRLLENPEAEVAALMITGLNGVCCSHLPQTRRTSRFPAEIEQRTAERRSLRRQTLTQTPTQSQVNSEETCCCQQMMNSFMDCRTLRERANAKFVQMKDQHAYFIFRKLLLLKTWFISLFLIFIKLAICMWCTRVPLREMLLWMCYHSCRPQHLWRILIEQLLLLILCVRAR